MTEKGASWVVSEVGVSPVKAPTDLGFPGGRKNPLVLHDAS